MASVGVLQGLVGLIEAGIEHGHKCRRIRNLLQHLVKILEDRSRSAQLAGAKAQGDRERGHQERGRGAVAGNIGDHHVHDIFGDLEEIVVVTAQ